MEHLPPIGTRVRYTPSRESFVFRGPLTGTVTEHYPGTRIDGDDDPDLGFGDGPELDLPVHDVAVGDPGWAERWSARVVVDELPDWWPYGDQRAFAPSIAELEPI